MMAAEWYILLGQSSSPAGISTGYGAYVGTSAALHFLNLRVQASLRHWSIGLGQLQPDAVILIRHSEYPVDLQVRLLVEAALARSISTRYSILNTRTGAPTAARRATRQQRLWAMHASDHLTAMVHRQVLGMHPPAAQGGSIREQLVRLVLNQNPHRSMDVDDILEAALTAGLVIPGLTPRQRSRRDVTTRELDTGRPRLHRTWIRGKAIVYPATMTLRDARRIYLAAHP
jgi:hypothetical protein